MNFNQSITGRLNTQYLAIENILSGIENNRLLIRPRPDKWNIHDNVAHLARYQPVFIDRINQILLTELPSFGRYSAEEDPEFENWRILDIESLIKRVKADRTSIHDSIINLSDDQLKRAGIHKKLGPLNIIEWTEFFLLHEAHHIFTIFQLAHDKDL